MSTEDIGTHWQCLECNHEFASEDLLPICPNCGAKGDSIIRLELE